MRKVVLVAVLAVTVSLAAVSAAPAKGLTAAQLSAAGWTCFPVQDLGIHCAPPGKAWPPTAPVVQLLYFDDAGVVFKGTETLVRDDVFQRRGNNVCPTEANGWFFIPPLGYWGCHRN